MRMCVGCREMKPKKELIRVVRSQEGAISLDRTSRLPGRGAYICAQQACLDKAVKIRALERALQQPLTADVLEQLKRELDRRDL
jgi:predicted RNA-binding protein YlxR (DUF448 family)